jgi:hypothetical protein
MSERFHEPTKKDLQKHNIFDALKKKIGAPIHDHKEEKHLNLTFFYSKLFTNDEMKTISDVD